MGFFRCLFQTKQKDGHQINVNGHNNTINIQLEKEKNRSL